MAPKDDPIWTNYQAIDGFTSNRHDTYPYIDPKQFNLAGKAVLVTGASKGIGRATAVRFAVAGASRIAILARTRSQLEAAAVEVKAAAVSAGRPEPQVLVLEADVSSTDAMRAAAETTAAAFDGVLNVVVSNAAYLEKWVPFLESDPGEWWKSWEVNMKGPYLTARFFLPLVLRASDGDTKFLVNVASSGSHLLSVGGHAYDTSRFALCRFNEFMEAEFESQGLITVSYHPGHVDTDLGRRLPKALHTWLVDSPELGADGIVWMAAERREWLNGRFVDCNWDMEELVAKKHDIVERDLFRFRARV